MTPSDPNSNQTWAEAVTTRPTREPLSTGFEDLDTLTAGGLRPGTLTIVASRPGMGRSTLLHDICRHNAIRHSRATALWTLEESAEDVATRFLSAEARVHRHHMLSGTLSEAEWERINKRIKDIQDAPLTVDAPPSVTAAVLSRQATELVEQRGVRLLAIDGVQDIRPEKRNDLREREVGDVVRDLKTLARELGVPVVATAHLNRSPEQRIGRRPRLDDLRESGAITFAADMIIMLHREDYYEPESPRAGEADLIVAKHRNGPTATVTVAFQGHYSRFANMAPYAPPTSRPDLRDGFGGLFRKGTEGA